MNFKGSFRVVDFVGYGTSEEVRIVYTNMDCSRLVGIHIDKPLLNDVLNSIDSAIRDGFDTIYCYVYTMEDYNNAKGAPYKGKKSRAIVTQSLIVRPVLTLIQGGIAC